MAERLVEIMSDSDGRKHLEIGIDAESLASFRLQAWIHKTGKRAIDWCSSLSLSYISFLGGDLYVHNSHEVPRLFLFGEQKEAKIGLVANQEPQEIKLLDSLMLDTDGQWEVESVVIPPSMNYPDGMYSKIPASMFVKREGVYESEFLRNMKTSSSTINALEALTGEPLRGNECLITLRTTSGDRIRLFRCQINMSKSR